jgi:proteasome lid subunit RPN8/RPN11
MTDRPEGDPAADAPALRVPRDLYDAVLDHCRAESPLEACGLIGGRDGAVTSVYPLRNAEASTHFFTADTRDLIAAHKAIRTRGEELAAIYHSHPRWAPEPSRTDLERHANGDVPQWIVSLLSEPPFTRLWRYEPDGPVELALAVVG